MRATNHERDRPETIREGAPQRRRRVLMTADPADESWSLALDLQAALAGSVDFAIATDGASLTREQREVARRKDLDLHLGCACRPDRRLERDAVADVGASLLRIAEETGADVVHLHDYRYGALPWRCPSFVYGHTCELSRWRAVRQAHPPARLHGYRQAVASGLRAADAVATPTRALLEEPRRLYGPVSGARVIPRGRNGVASQQRRKAPFVLAVGGLADEARNVRSLVAAAPHVRWPITIAASEDDMAAAGRVPPSVRLLGGLPQDAISGEMERAAIFALPARYEPLGLSAVDAALRGCALVLGDIPSLREVWGDAALYVPPDDPAILGLALRRLAAADRVRERYAARAEARARQLDPHRTARACRAVYDELVARPASSRPQGGGR